MNGNPQGQIVLGLMVDAARLHWARILTLIATAAIFIPLAGLVALPAFDIAPLPETAEPGTPPEITPNPVALLFAMFFIGFLVAAIFVVWLRIALMGTPAAFQQPIGSFFTQSIRTLGYFIAATLIGLVPVSFLGSLLMAGGSPSAGPMAFLVLIASAAVTAAMALFFLRLMEIATGTKPIGTSEQRAQANAFRPLLALTLVAAMLAVTFVGGVIVQLLIAMGAVVSGALAQGMLLTFSITYMAVIFGLAFRHIMETT